MKLKSKEIIIVKESVFTSWLKDGFTFGCMFGMYYLNHKFTDGSWFIDFAITMFFIFTLIAMFHNKKELTIEEIIEKLKKIEEQTK